MASEGGAKSGKEKRAKRSAGGSAREKNPIVQQARTRYTEELRKQGVAQDQMKAKVKTHLKDVVKPAMTEAKANAKQKNLKGPERKKFIQESVRSKLGLQA